MSSGDPGLDRLLDGVARAHEGDADALEDVVAPDVVWRDDDEVLEGVDEVVGHFLAHGGWREVFHLGNVTPEGSGGWVVEWTLWFRADSTSHRRDGQARVVVDGGRITRWESSATEREDGSLAAWGGD